MKFLKYFLFVIGALVLIALILGLVGPKTYDVHRSAIVAGSPEQVWPYVSNLKNMALWSPWAEKDTNMVVEYSGTDGAVGSSSTWSGNKHVGRGSQTITVLEPHSYAEFELKFFEPWTAEATAYTRLADTTGGTYVSWGIKGENDFIGRIMGSVMNMDKMMAPDFEKGLSKLSALVASGPKMESAGHTIVPGEYPGGKYLGVRGIVPMAQIETFYSTNLGQVFEALQKGGVEITGMPTGLYYTWDMEKKESDMAAAVGFKGDLKNVPSGMVVLELPAARSLTLDYRGGYHGLEAAHGSLEKYMIENKLEYIAPAVEEYVTDPGEEPDSTKWLTKIVYFVK